MVPTGLPDPGSSCDAPHHPGQSLGDVEIPFLPPVHGVVHVSHWGWPRREHIVFPGIKLPTDVCKNLFETQIEP